MKEGESAVIRHILDHGKKARLIALGFRQGRTIQILRKSGFSSNIMVEIYGTTYGLRPEEAQYIIVTNLQAK